MQAKHIIILTLVIIFTSLGCESGEIIEDNHITNYPEIEEQGTFVPKYSAVFLNGNLKRSKNTSYSFSLEGENIKIFQEKNARNFEVELDSTIRKDGYSYTKGFISTSLMGIEDVFPFYVAKKGDNIVALRVNNFWFFSDLKTLDAKIKSLKKEPQGVQYDVPTLCAYKVQRGDTESGIARKFNLTIYQLYDYEPRLRSRKLQAGWVFHLPCLN